VREPMVPFRTLLLLTFGKVIRTLLLLTFGKVIFKSDKSDSYLEKLLASLIFGKCLYSLFL
jgi:hypothetical protein